ncbi:MAG: hypothetical protein PVF63_10885, partial [Gammaproteobacteria bacterium]
ARPRRKEWAFAWHSSEEASLDSVSVQNPSPEPPDETSCQFARVAGDNMPSKMRLAPRLGDRAFVVRPDLRLSLPAGQQTVLFISTVLWVTVSIELDATESTQATLLDVPAARPSDTWFGPNTLEGELCYASRTNARTDLAEIGPRPHRAVTPVEIFNRGIDALDVEQLRVPVSTLRLYDSADGRIWTDSVRFIRDKGEREAQLEISEASDHLPSELRQISEPRHTAEVGTIVAAFSRFLG